MRALINGIPYAETNSMIYQGNSVYSLDIPADDLSTPVKEGGIEGETVTFLVAEFPASPNADWHSGVNMELNLSASTAPGQPTATSASPSGSLTATQAATSVRSVAPTRTPRTQTAIPGASQQVSTPAQATPAVEISTATFVQPTATGVQMTAPPPPASTAVRQIFMTPFPTLPPAQASPAPLPEVEAENPNPGSQLFLAPAILVMAALLVWTFRKRSRQKDDINEK